MDFDKRHWYQVATIDSGDTDRCMMCKRLIFLSNYNWKRSRNSYNIPFVSDQWLCNGCGYLFLV